MLGLFMLALMLYARNPARWTWPLAAVAFALPWVRLEYIAISLAATVALCVIEWSWRERPAGVSLRAAILSTAPLRALVLIASATAGILIYFAYNKLVFGGIVPVSGATKQAWQRFYWERDGGYNFVQNLQDTLQIPVFDLELLVALGGCVILLLVWWFARRSRDERDWLLLVFLVGVFGLAAGHIAKFAQTVLTVHPDEPLWLWYFVPAYLLMALALPIGCCIVVHFIRRFVAPWSTRTANTLSVAAVVIAVVLLWFNGDFAYPFQRVDASSKDTRVGWAPTNYLTIQTVNRVLPDESIVGAWDAGVVGYFSRFPVVNLDGLVNDYDYLNAYVAAGGKRFWVLEQQFGDTEPFFKKFGINHFINYAITRKLHMTLLEGAVYHGNGSKVGYQLWASHDLRGFDSAAWFWKRIEPHFDYQRNGIGLTLDGRMTQIFAKDCDADDVTVVFWSTPDGANDSRFIPLNENDNGLCVASALLPHGATPPVRVATMSVGDYLAELIGNSPPAIRSDYDVYVNSDRLIYVKEQCSDADVAHHFFLHLDPVRQGDLPGHRRSAGFDNLDFGFTEYGHQLGGTCITIRELPDYDIAAIRTGQYEWVDGDFKHVWEGEIIVVK